MDFYNKILDISKQVANEVKFSELHTFNDEMTVSQVVRFFEKYNIHFTKTMIQNYVRVGVIPPPFEKRYYTKRHLTLLFLINNLKNIYSLEDIKDIFSPILKDPETFDDDLIDVTDIYKDYTELYEYAVAQWDKTLPETLKKVEQIIKERKVENDDKEIVKVFMTLLMIMAQSIAMKQMVKYIHEEYSK